MTDTTTRPDQRTPIDFRINLTWPPPPDALPADVRAKLDPYLKVGGRIAEIDTALDAMPALMAEARAADATAAVEKLDNPKAKPSAQLADLRGQEAALLAEREALANAVPGTLENAECAITEYVNGPARDEVVDVVGLAGARLDEALATIVGILNLVNGAHRHYESALSLVKSNGHTAGRWPLDHQLRDAIDADAIARSIRGTFDDEVADLLASIGAAG